MREVALGELRPPTIAHKATGVPVLRPGALKSSNSKLRRLVVSHSTNPATYSQVPPSQSHECEQSRRKRHQQSPALMDTHEPVKDAGNPGEWTASPLHRCCRPLPLIPGPLQSSGASISFPQEPHRIKVLLITALYGECKMVQNSPISPQEVKCCMIQPSYS